ncbi:MAG: hypothetical protein ACI8Z5_001583, partial [Lentimonas sp.]
SDRGASPSPACEANDCAYGAINDTFSPDFVYPA